ncbi:unnamed protein product [Tuber aestivum]|uniref:Uncharacterized protein n=1 Tax=Tuber aestivum TaxID=59557 RepID=A0A292Q6C3_9PEZI|nr:unnamed protein product [Tuber aestivum]
MALFSPSLCQSPNLPTRHTPRDSTTIGTQCSLCRKSNPPLDDLPFTTTSSSLSTTNLPLNSQRSRTYYPATLFHPSSPTEIRSHTPPPTPQFHLLTTQYGIPILIPFPLFHPSPISPSKNEA